MAKKVFNMQGGLHSAAAYAAFENRAYGSCVANAASLAVTPGAGMNLNISSGDGLISVDAFLGRLIQVTATETAAVSAANATFNRLDTVVAYIDTAVAPTTAVVDNVNDILKFKVVPGTAAATPVAPTGAAIQASIGAGNPYMALYDVLLPSAAVNVAGVTLTDRRKVLTVVDVANIPNGSIPDAKLAAGISSGKLYNPYKFSAYCNAGKAIANTTLIVDLQVELFDTSNNFANSRYTAPVAGFYFINAQAFLGSAGAGTTEWGTATIRKNGVDIYASDRMNGNGDANRLIRCKAAGLVQMVAGDYIELYASFQGARDITPGQNSTYMHGWLVSAT